MKSILLSVQPKWVVKILNGEKTIEVRKRFPKEYKGWVYIYCSKTFTKWKGARGYRKDLMINDYVANGKVVARFYCDKVEEIKKYEGLFHRFGGYIYHTNYNEETLLNKSCLDIYEMNKYLKGNNGYAIHISQLEIFGKPQELSEFKTRHYPQFVGMVKNKTHYELKPITKAPQSFMYVEIELHYTPEIPGDNLDDFVGKYDPENMIKRATERRKKNDHRNDSN